MTDYVQDRIVHARYPGWEVVRYERAGKWYLEPTEPGSKREPITLRVAVLNARHALDSGGEVFTGRPGGRSFDAKLANAMERKAPTPREVAAINQAVVNLANQSCQHPNDGWTGLNRPTTMLLGYHARVLIKGLDIEVDAIRIDPRTASVTVDLDAVSAAISDELRECELLAKLVDATAAEAGDRGNASVCPACGKGLTDQ